jgi:hypothetical protein
MKLKHALAASALAISGLAQAATIDWNQWTSNSTGAIGSTPVTITFTGQDNGGWYAGYPSYGPGPTWADGTVVANAPTGGIVVLSGGNGNVQTVTFSQAVTNPIFAIWSLGQGGVNASFDFIGATPVFVAGGGSNEYGGSAIVVNGNSVSGNEGNGTVEFIGTYTSLSWTNPTYEYWYGFNVGITDVAPAVPEPASIGLLLAGLTLVGLARRRRAK